MGARHDTDRDFHSIEKVLRVVFPIRFDMADIEPGLCFHGFPLRRPAMFHQRLATKHGEAFQRAPITRDAMNALDVAPTALHQQAQEQG